MARTPFGRFGKFVRRAQPAEPGRIDPPDEIDEDPITTPHAGVDGDDPDTEIIATEEAPDDQDGQDDDEDAHPLPSLADLLTAASPTPADRLAAASRRRLDERLTPTPTVPDPARAAVAARWPAVKAAVVPRLPRLTVTIVAGVLLFASFPTSNWWWAAVVAFALLAWVLTRPATTLVGGAGYGFLFGLVFYVPLLPWISLLVGAMPWLVLATVQALYPGLFGLFAVVVRRLPGWPLWFALLWAAQEWLKSTWPFGGFPWGSVAYGQTGGPLLPLVQLGGVALLSTAIVLVGCSFTAIALEIVKWFRTAKASEEPSEASEASETRVVPAPPAVVLPGVCICLVLLAAALVWPGVRHASTGSSGEPTATVAVVQGNVPRLGFDFNAQRRAVLDNHVQETLRLAEDVRRGAAPQPQLVIWPENASDIDPLVNPDAGQQISEAADAIGAPILVGTILDVPGSPQDVPEYTNTVLVWNPVTGVADRHDKEIVQPFGEYLPMPWLFKHLSGYASRAGHIVPRAGSDVVQMGRVPVGVATCWEVIFDREPRKAVLNGAQLLAVPSNNATFNQAMSEQQLTFAKVRAVEHDRYVVVAGTTGISAVIAPDGAEVVRTGFFEPAYLDNQVRLKTRLTPATQWGPILQLILVGAAAAAILAAIRQNGWLKRPIRLRPKPSGESDDSGPAPEGASEASDGPEDAPDEGNPDISDNPPDPGGDYTPHDKGGHHRSGRPPRYFPRHKGVT
jgi:apolipoprotein N-acyltransferase